MPQERHARPASYAPPVDRASRAVGAIVGLAVGDALGAPFEFRRATDDPDARCPPSSCRGWAMPPGTWTDDTAMARNLWRSLLAHDGALDLDDVLARHLAWLATDHPTSGTRRVPRCWRPRRGTPEPARAVFERRGPEVSAGNGSVMYCAPLGVVRAGDPERLRDEAPALSRITHWDGRCRTACLAVTWAVAALVRGEAPEDGGPRRAWRPTQAVGGRTRSSSTWSAEAGRARPLDGPDMGFTLFTRRDRAPGGRRGPRVRGGAPPRRRVSAVTPTRTRRWPARCSAPRTAWRRSRPPGSTASPSARRS